MAVEWERTECYRTHERHAAPMHMHNGDDKRGPRGLIYIMVLPSITNWFHAPSLIPWDLLQKNGDKGPKPPLMLRPFCKGNA